MHVLEPLRLVRLCGPLVVGVCLERDSSNAAYTPTSHVHMLGKGARLIGLTLARRLRTVRTDAPDSITVVGHEQRYKEASQRLKSQAPIPLDGRVTLKHVIDAYEAEIQRPSTHVAIPLYEDLVIACSWVGDRVRATAYVEKAVDVLRRWPSAMAAQFAGVDGWRERYGMLPTAFEELKRRVQADIDALRLGALSDEGLARNE